MPKTAISEDRSESLPERWTALYKEELPRLAKARDRAQPKWPVYLDHCFARIILDNAVGKDRPWMERIRAPAVKHMSEEQLKAAVEMGRQIATGEADLDDLNQRSLRLRGKEGPKRKREVSDDSHGQGSPRKWKSKPGNGDIRSHFFGDLPQAKAEAPAPELREARRTIASSKDLTPFRRFALILLTFIPRGRYSTYGAMSNYITAQYHKSSARAIGNAMRNNPFAPAVPCHRVLAHDGRIGGFGGDWGEQGKHSAEKRRLLAEEGVKFDSGGKVVGRPYINFEESGEIKTWYQQIYASNSK
ncbi:Methylated-DNA [Macrophomina phaseolina MS6]|uniref:Methylated-DNA--protein-cysteine methyltransferase n=1 Tax=Macrophomina phaseolina (strain MS6) TaxID=1126212 RepID=K2S367_MACPH|nr:Methylated-DNA [Macrophomina phaseolina MS6]